MGLLNNLQELKQTEAFRQSWTEARKTCEYAQKTIFLILPWHHFGCYTVPFANEQSLSSFTLKNKQINWRKTCLWQWNRNLRTVAQNCFFGHFTSWAHLPDDLIGGELSCVIWQSLWLLAGVAYTHLWLADRGPTTLKNHQNQNHIYRPSMLTQTGEGGRDRGREEKKNEYMSMNVMYL